MSKKCLFCKKTERMGYYYIQGEPEPISHCGKKKCWKAASAKAKEIKAKTGKPCDWGRVRLPYE